MTGILADGKPLPADSEANAKVRARMLVALRASGYQPEIQETTACRRLAVYVCARVRNIVAVRKRAPPGRTVLLSAHSDSVAAGPGASDDGSGVARALGRGAAMTPVFPAGGPTQHVSLLFPKAMRLRAIDIDGQTLDYTGDRSGGDRYDPLHCRGDACSGIALTLTLGDRIPATVVIQTNSAIASMADAAIAAS